LVSERKLLTN
jgi:hypothetical protein